MKTYVYLTSKQANSIPKKVIKFHERDTSVDY